MTGIKILNNVIHGGALSTSVNHGGLSIPKFDDSNMIVRNNIFLHNTNKDIYVKVGANTTGDIFEKNMFHKTDFTNNWQWKGTNYSTLSSWQSASFLDLSSLVGNPICSNTSGSYTDKTDFQLQSTSPAIDAGTGINLTTDYAGNPIYGTPDIGAYEYQPPYTMGTTGINISAGARIYADGKFRNLTVAGSETADLKITPESGNFPVYNTTDIRPDFMDVTHITWSNTGTHHKTWTESSSTLGTSRTTHTVGDLEANKNYNVKVDTILGAGIIGTGGTVCSMGVCRSNSSGKIVFLYT